MRLLPFWLSWRLETWSIRRRVYPVKRRVSRLRRWLVRGLLLALLLPIGASAALTLSLRWFPPPFTAFMFVQRQAALAQRGSYEIDYRWVDWQHISAHMRIAVVAAEDQRFPVHSGFDVHSIGDAVRERVFEGRTRGASTISQQVAKNLFLWPERSLLRKGLEAWFTVLIEALWPKQRILEVYLNVAEFGPGIFGVAAAGERYFATTPARLGPGQAALLAAVLPNPARMRADRPSPYVLGRRDWILSQMHSLGPEYLAL